MPPLETRVHVQLNELERIAEPLLLLVHSEHRGDLLAPPQPGLAGVAVGEAHQLLGGIECAKGAKAGPFGVTSNHGALGKHPLAAQRIAQRGGENTKQGLVVRPCKLFGRERPDVHAACFTTRSSGMATGGWVVNASRSSTTSTTT